MTRVPAAALLLALAACHGSGVPAPPPDPYPGAPTAAAYPPAGSYAAVQYVTLAADEPGIIYWSTDGAAPVAGAANTRFGRNPVFWLRAGPGTTTLAFFAVDDAGNRGPTASATYTVEIPP